MIGKTYHRRYGYPWHWAILAGLAWHLECFPFRQDGQVFGPLARRAYRWRKRCEHRGYIASRSG